MTMEKITYKGKEYTVKYNHIRKRKSNGEYETKGGITVAFIEEGFGEDTRRVIQTIAKCHRKDPYNKKMGRKIAYGRLKKLSEEHL